MLDLAGIPPLRACSPFHSRRVRVIALAVPCAILLACERAPTPVPPDPRVADLLAKAEALHARGDAGESLKALEAALAITPDSTDVLREIAAVALQGGDLQRARDAASRVLAAVPDDVVSLSALGMLAIREGDFAASARRFEKVVELRRNAADFEALGRAYSGLGEGEKAMTAFRRALELEPKNASALYGLGLLALRQNRLDEARRRFEEALVLRPNDERCLFNLGNILVRTGDPSRAEAVLREFEAKRKVLSQVEALESAARARPDSADIQCALAETYARANRLEDSIRAYLQGLQASPGHRRCLRGITRLAIQWNQTADAREMLEEALAREPGAPEILSLIAEIDEAIRRGAKKS